MGKDTNPNYLVNLTRSLLRQAAHGPEFTKASDEDFLDVCLRMLDEAKNDTLGRIVGYAFADEISRGNHDNGRSVLTAAALKVIQRYRSIIMGKCPVCGGATSLDVFHCSLRGNRQVHQIQLTEQEVDMA